MPRDSLFVWVTLTLFFVAVVAVVVMVRPLVPSLARASAPFSAAHSPVSAANLAGSAVAAGAVPAGYAPPWDVFTGEQFLSVEPTSSAGSIKVVFDRPGALVYRTFYVSHGGEWEPHNFSGSLWSRDHATQSVEIDDTFDDEEGVLIYTCKRNRKARDGWDCGCRSTDDPVCRAFAVQTFKPAPTNPAVCEPFITCVAPAPGFPASATALPFKDVPPTGWTAGFYPSIMTARALGITVGFGDNKFNPAGPTSRGAAAVFLMKAFSLPPGMSSAPSFADVPVDNPFFAAVESVHAAGLMNGYGDTFGVDDPLTRAQLAVVVAKAMGLDTSGYDDVQTFSDVLPTGPGSWAHGFIEALHDAGLIVGYPDGTYRPTQPVTRAQALSVIMKGAFGFKSCENCDKLSYECDTHGLTLTPVDECVAESGKIKPIIPVLVLSYLPLKEDGSLDLTQTGDWQDPNADHLRQHIATLTTQTITALEEGSAYKGYKTNNQPYLKYTVLKNVEFPRQIRRSVEFAPFPDHLTELSDIDICDWVENRGVKEVWIWMTHLDKEGEENDLVPIESNMAGPNGDISNSARAPDLPVCAKTYTVYDYNYGRGVSESVEDHTHQIEAVLNWVDGRDETPPEQWNSLLFWGKFVGSDVSGHIIKPGCGWTHYPPNGQQAYDWFNTSPVISDCVNWHPDGNVDWQTLSCYDWSSTGASDDPCHNSAEPLEDAATRFKIWWMQNIPGEGNSLCYQGKRLRNWLEFIADFDKALAKGKSLVSAEACGMTGDDFCYDNDGDGYNRSANPACGPQDCNDADATIHPGATEQCGDGVDQDCDGADEQCGDWQLVWHDEFDGSGPIDPERWGFVIGTNPYWGDGLQYYTNRTENARRENGHLVIESHKEQYDGYNYTSARISTRNRAYWRYGRVELRAKLPAGIGMKSAIWMMPQFQTYGNHGWPDNGEIDIMENVGWKPTTIFSTVHRKPRSANERVWSVQGRATATDPENNWHTYWLEWTPENMTLGVDDQTTLFLVNDGQGWEHWPFDQPFYLILSHPVADSWSTKKHTFPFDDSILPKQFLIDYVRVYQECGEDADCPVGMTCNGACVSV